MLSQSFAVALLALLPSALAVPFSSKLHKNTALILIDIQNDFITGSLNNSRAPSILPKVYQLLDDHEWPFIVASQDWHPENHVSFAINHSGVKAFEAVNITFVDTPTKIETQTVYPNHCVPETEGAEIEKGVQTRLHYLEGYRTPVNYIKKAQDHSVDSYSAFADNQYHRFTTLNKELTIHGVETIVVTGLITDACVRGTCIDGIKLGYEVILVEDATETTSEEIKQKTIAELQGWGVQVMNLSSWEAANPTGLQKRAKTELYSDIQCFCNDTIRQPYNETTLKGLGPLTQASKRHIRHIISPIPSQGPDLPLSLPPLQSALSIYRAKLFRCIRLLHLPNAVAKCAIPSGIDEYTSQNSVPASLFLRTLLFRHRIGVGNIFDPMVETMSGINFTDITIMKSLLILLVALPLALASVIKETKPWAPVEKKVDYSGFKVLRITLAEKSAELEAKIDELTAHVLNPGKAAFLDVVVSPDNVDAVAALAVESVVITENVGLALEEEEDQVSISAVPSETWFTAYHPYADHLTFLTDLQSSFTANSEIITAGTSTQGRVLRGIHIWGSGGKGSKPAVLFHGTVHAREWVATLTTEYTAWQLLTKYATDTAVKALVDRFDFYIIPIVNPDGFVYTQTTDRLWRKNRQTVTTSTCVGRDINRNWSYKWEVTGGASTNPCSETFKGLAPGDSPENQGLASQVNALRDAAGIRLYIDFHSYGQHILWPYGYSCSLVVENSAAHRSLATASQTAIRAVSGTSYTIGPSCSTLYPTTGSSTDYTDVTGNSTYSYTYELRDTGNNGFTLPASQIKPTVVETWAGVVAMLQAA
ncbi:hypothetical protein K504DRAFT_535085 [Pleomassaria siparia CBS 279.74]|uniref:Peptidase M14 domain-containing protein n=1 Tax=Pleomassaria siparia CBS 279.74 TaxID=1314801 RepID=A0A6G1K7I6_9PLEO|nr:hypothetical protein K504DRAFT_535085 [Pleomassaria siparia CBS 279.74]